MAHFAFISPLFTGHITPMAAVARELRARGHRTTLINIPDGEAIAGKYGFEYELVGAKTHPPGHFEKMVRLCGQVSGLRGYGLLRQDAIDSLRMFCREVPAKLRAIDADFVICDQSEAAGSLIAYHLHLPFVSLAMALPFNWEPGVPPTAFGWNYGATRWHRWRNIAGAYAFHRFLGPYLDAAQDIARNWKLRMGRDIHEYMSGLAQISQLIPSLDMPRQSLSGCFHYCGPLRAIATQTAPPGPRDPDCVFASLGSVQGHRLDIFEAIARATKANGLRLALSHGGKLDAAACEQLVRAGADVHTYVDQADMMARVGLAVLHGGLNTVLDAAAAGVPMVMVPVGFEQKATSARVQLSGAGRVCPLWRAQSGRLAALLGEVRRNPVYAAAAGELRDEVVASGGTHRAVDIIEEVLRTGRAVLSEEGRRRRDEHRAAIAPAANAA